MKKKLMNIFKECKDFIDNNYKKIIYYYLIITLVTVFITSVLVTFSHLTLENSSFILIGLGGIGLVIYSLCIAIDKIELNITDFLIGMLFVIGLFSVINAVVPKMALWGSKGRFEGLLSLSTYYILFLNAKNLGDKKLIRNIIYLILFLGGIQVIYGLIQSLNYKLHFFTSRVDQEYAYGFVGNTDFMGSLMCLCYGLSVGISFFKEKVKYYDIIIVILFTFGAILTGCMSCLVGVACINFLIIFIAIYNLIKKNKKFSFLCFKRLFLAIIIFVSSYEICTNFIFHKIDSDVNEMVDQISDIVIEKKSNENYGNGRFYIWQNTLKIVPENLLNGAGIDNFVVAFNNGPLFYYDTRMYYDKAHNEYLQILVTEGLPAILTYLSLLFVLFFGRLFKIKSINDYLLIAVLLSFFGYIAQAFFNISITRVAPIFWIIMGLVSNNQMKEEKKLSKTLD